MFEIEGRTPLHKLTRSLVDTAMGRQKADLVVQNASLVNVNSGEITEKQDVAVKKNRIALIGNAQHTIGPETERVDAAGKYLVPGFIDGHMHIESAMVTPTQFARAVLPHGTTTVFADPHEITNVLGLNGVRFFLEESKRLPLKLLITFPSCVPAAPGFETSGAQIGPADVERALRWKRVVALGEMMNYPGVLSSDSKVHGEIAATLRAGLSRRSCSRPARQRSCSIHGRRNHIMPRINQQDPSGAEVEVGHVRYAQRSFRVP